MASFAGPVGGIFYRPTEKKNLDIYGEEIDFNSLLSSIHQPVQVGAQQTRGYQQQYRWTPRTESSSDSEQKDTQNQSTKDTPAPALIIPASGDIKSSETHLSGKDGFKQLEQLYADALENRGISTKYAKWLAAQDALESGWGKSQGAKRHNYGNIITGSSWNGNSFIGDDHDENNNPITQRFRSYNSVEEYIEDKLNLLQSKRYESAFIGDVDKFIDRIYKSGYAVDPQYVQKVKSVYNNWA